MCNQIQVMFQNQASCPQQAAFKGAIVDSLTIFVILTESLLIS